MTENNNIIEDDLSKDINLNDIYKEVMNTSIVEKFKELTDEFSDCEINFSIHRFPTVNNVSFKIEANKKGDNKIIGYGFDSLIFHNYDNLSLLVNLIEDEILVVRRQLTKNQASANNTKEQ
jgi:hypothetical protein